MTENRREEKEMRKEGKGVERRRDGNKDRRGGLLRGKKKRM